MLAISSDSYKLPSFDEAKGVWVCESKRNSDEVLIARQFHYTLLNKESGDKYTFLYNGKSVAPAPRTLRIYTAKGLQKVVSTLSSRRVNIIDFSSVDTDDVFINDGEILTEAEKAMVNF